MVLMSYRQRLGVGEKEVFKEKSIMIFSVYNMSKNFPVIDECKTGYVINFMCVLEDESKARI